MLDFLNQFILYPFSEVVHSLQGLLAGYLASRAIIKKEVSDAICALLITLAFAIYETLEMVRIEDHGDQDFEVFWSTAIFTGLIYLVIHLWRLRK